MREWPTPNGHVRWYCRHHVVWASSTTPPKYRKRGDLRARSCDVGFGESFGLCQRPAWVDRVMPVGSRAHSLGITAVQRGARCNRFLKREVMRRSAFTGSYLGRQRNFTWKGYHFARGYCVSTVGLAEEVIRDYIRNRKLDEKKQGSWTTRG